MASRHTEPVGSVDHVRLLDKIVANEILGITVVRVYAPHSCGSKVYLRRRLKGKEFINGVALGQFLSGTLPQDQLPRTHATGKEVSRDRAARQSMMPCDT